jgi:hypothetical protein
MVRDQAHLPGVTFTIYVLADDQDSPVKSKPGCASFSDGEGRILRPGT